MLGRLYVGLLCVENCMETVDMKVMCCLLRNQRALLLWATISPGSERKRHHNNVSEISNALRLFRMLHDPIFSSR